MCDSANARTLIRERCCAALPMRGVSSATSNGLVIAADIFTNSIEQAKVEERSPGLFGDLTHTWLLHARIQKECQRKEKGRKPGSDAQLVMMVSGPTNWPTVFLHPSALCVWQSRFEVFIFTQFLRMQILKSTSRLPSARPTRAAAVAPRRPLLVIKQQLRRFCVVRASEVSEAWRGSAIPL